MAKHQVATVMSLGLPFNDHLSRFRITRNGSLRVARHRVSGDPVQTLRFICRNITEHKEEPVVFILWMERETVDLTPRDRQHF